ncbi:hypothetical protein K1719_047429 [Acacia pycnantha]|nr:hypothetical protein K1719_047429 [Acacia pycnantha]
MDRAAWDSELTRSLLDACIIQINAGDREGKGRGHVKKYSQKAWDTILSTFNNETSKQYKRCHLKNRLDVLRRVYRDWLRILKEPGAVVEAADDTYKLVQTNEWWEHIVKENAYRKFRYDGLIHGEAMRQPQKQKEGLNLPSEGSGDSEDEIFGFEALHSTGMSDEMQGLGCRSNTPSSAGITGSRSKRKTCGEGSFQETGKKKVLSERNMTDAYSAMDKLSVLIEHRHVNVTGESDDHLEALHVLYGLEKFKNNEDFRRSCMSLLGDPESQKMLIAFGKMGKVKYLVECILGPFEQTNSHCSDCTTFHDIAIKHDVTILQENGPATIHHSHAASCYYKIRTESDETE